MDNRSIDKLPVKRFNTETTKRVMRGYEGNTTSIRSINPHDRIDMERMKAIEKTNSEFLIGESMNDKELREWAADRSGEEGMVFAIVKSNPDDPKDWGEMQGQIYFYNDEAERIEDMKKKGLIKGEDSHVIEVSYQKVPGADKGQMDQGLRQACAEFSRRDAARLATETQQQENQDRADFNAKIKQKIESGLTLEERVAALEEFEAKMVQKYPPKPSTIVTAYVRPENAPSIKMLERSGFVQKGIVKYEGFEEDHQDHLLYVLDWDLLHKKLQDDADQALVAKREA